VADFGNFVSNMYIQNAISTMGLEAMNNKISAVITSEQWWRRGRKSRGCKGCHRAARIGMNKGFIMDQLQVKSPFLDWAIHHRAHCGGQGQDHQESKHGHTNVQ